MSNHVRLPGDIGTSLGTANEAVANVSCWAVDGPCYQVAKDFTPLVAVVVALFAAGFSVWNVNRQLRHARERHDMQLAYSYAAVRYDAVRRKVATSKALLQEIYTLNYHAECEVGNAVLDPAAYPALLSEIGQLDEESIRYIVQFYASYTRMRLGGGNIESINEDVPVNGRAAIQALEDFQDAAKLEHDIVKAEMQKARDRLAADAAE